MKLLFVCTENRLRSPTAETVFSQYPDVETASAGVSPSATKVVSRDLIEWADIVFAMEQDQCGILTDRFSDLLADRPPVCLNIPDTFGYMEPRLVALLETKLCDYIREK